MASIEKIRVWDPVVRIGHWVLVAAFFVAYFTEDDFLSAHVWAGYAVAIVVVVRLIWGFVGSRYARFGSFLYAPPAVLAYLFALIRGGGRRYVGHSPAGAAMIFFLLVSLAATVLSGLTVYAYDRHAGPFASFVGVGGEAETRGAAGAATASESFEAREEAWEEVHEVLANITLALVVLHIAGVLLASFVHRENLVGAMITGDKRPEA